MQERSLLVQVLLDMATGGAKLEPLIVDKAGVFDAGLNKGYNPVTVTGGNTTVLAEKGAVANHAVIITPEARVVAGWQDGKSITGEGIGVTARELVSGTYNVSQAGSTDVTNYQNINVKSGGTTASIDKMAVAAHTVRFTPKATVAQGWQDSNTVSGESVDVNASELVSGTYPVTASGEFDVTTYEKISVPSGVVSANAVKGIVANHSVLITPSATRTAGFINSGETVGQGVRVDASELVSGRLTVTQNGVIDVTNYKEIEVSGLMTKETLAEGTFDVTLSGGNSTQLGSVNLFSVAENKFYLGYIFELTLTSSTATGVVGLCLMNSNASYSKYGKNTPWVSLPTEWLNKTVSKVTLINAYGRNGVNIGFDSGSSVSGAEYSETVNFGLFSATGSPRVTGNYKIIGFNF